MNDWWTILITFEDGFQLETECNAIHEMSDAVADAVIGKLNTGHGCISEIRMY